MVTFTVDEVLQWLKDLRARIVNSEELGLQQIRIEVTRPASLRGSTPNDLVFFFSRAYENELPFVHAGILITGEAFVQPLQQARLPFWNSTAVISCEDPYLAMALISEKFAAKSSSVSHLALSRGAPKIHPTAWIDSSVHLGEGVEIGAHCVIEGEAKIGTGTLLYPGCYIGPSSQIGESCVFFPRVTIYEWVVIGNRVRLHSGCVIGADGFGYAPRKKDQQVTGHQKIYHLGKVILGDDVEIGANSCVDRATIGETRIGNQVKLDNLVHIGHNAQLDEGAIVCGGTCLAGNAKIGKFAYIGGNSGITNHVQVGDGASVGALSLVTKDVPNGGTAVGNPQRDYREHFRAHALLSRMLSKRRSDS